MKRTILVVLDEEYEKKLASYSLYRSLELSGNERPIIDGLYIQRKELGNPPPIKMKLTIEQV